MKGTIEDDGDYQLNIAVIGTYKRFLNDQNNKQVNGMLVVKISPKDQGSASIKIPKKGDLVEVHEPWVMIILMDGMKYILLGKSD